MITIYQIRAPVNEYGTKIVVVLCIDNEKDTGLCIELRSREVILGFNACGDRQNSDEEALLPIIAIMIVSYRRKER